MKNILFLILIILLSCNDTKYIRKYSLPKIKDVQFSENNKVNTQSQEFTWEVPSKWIAGVKSSLRIASYKVPYSDGFGDLSISHFQGDGGGLVANINRWRKQIDLENQTLDQIRKNAIYGQSQIGEYKMFKIVNNNNPSIAFICSIISTKISTIFIKLNVTVKGINELEEEFKKFTSTFRYLNNEK